jgi:hypothetical protein
MESKGKGRKEVVGRMERGSKREGRNGVLTSFGYGTCRGEACLLYGLNVPGARVVATATATATAAIAAAAATVIAVHNAAVAAAAHAEVTTAAGTFVLHSIVTNISSRVLS